MSVHMVQVTHIHQCAYGASYSHIHCDTHVSTVIMGETRIDEFVIISQDYILFISRLFITTVNFAVTTPLPLIVKFD